MLVPWFNYNACSITRDSQGKRVQFARQHAKVRDFTSRHACLEVKFGFRQIQVCFIGGSLPVILISMGSPQPRTQTLLATVCALPKEKPTNRKYKTAVQKFKHPISSKIAVCGIAVVV